MEKLEWCVEPNVAFYVFPQKGYLYKSTRVRGKSIGIKEEGNASFRIDFIVVLWEFS